MRPPVFQWFVRRVVLWTVLVWGCALPLMIVTWTRATPGGRLGEVCGVAMWTIAVIARDLQLHGLFSGSAWPTLRSGAVALLVLQGLAAAVFSPFFFYFLYAPALLLVSSLRLIPDDASLFYGDLVLTIVCGGQAFACAWALGRLVERLRPRLGGSRTAKVSVG